MYKDDEILKMMDADFDRKTLMDSMAPKPKSREMYRGFKMPANMAPDQEIRYKAAIDERESGRAARQRKRDAPKSSRAAHSGYDPMRGYQTPLDAKLREDKS
jgi:hypothetical protein